MTIEIKIPQNIINKCTECGWGEQEIKVHFATYLSEVMNHPYGHFEQDFETWLEDLDEEELSRSNYPANVEGSVEFNEFNEEFQQEGLTIEDLRGKRFVSKDYIRPVYVVGPSTDGICTIEWMATLSASLQSTTYTDAQVVHYFNNGTWILFE